MRNAVPRDLDFDYEELKGFARSMAEIEWLMLILALLYMLIPGTRVTSQPGLTASMVAFAAFVIGFHYVNFYRLPRRWKLAVESWAMIGFVTAALYFTGGIESPLLNLYLLAIIASALTLGKLTTLLEVALISGCYLWLAFEAGDADAGSAETLAGLFTGLSPFLLVGYLTTMLSNDLQQARSRVGTLADTDSLTGLLNRRGFQRLLEKEHERASGIGRGYGVLMVDANGLKPINDRYGHEAGDRLLRQISAVLTGVFRDTDCVARYGGDEFVILLNGAGPEENEAARQRIYRAIERSRVRVAEESLPFSVSVGGAAYPYDGASASDVLRAADGDMYQQKHLSPGPARTEPRAG